MSPKKRNKTNPPIEAPHEDAEKNRMGLERLIFFTDAVFAIAITLLALDIRLPAGAADADLSASLTAMLPKYMAYVLSFLVIGSFWIAHHRKFQYIQRYDGRLLLINLFILMGVAFIPFPSSVISENGSFTATTFYALTMTLIGLLYAALWRHAARQDRLIDASLTPQQRRREQLAPLVTSAIFLVSIGIAFLNPGLARLTWILILPVSLVMKKG